MKKAEILARRVNRFLRANEKLRPQYEKLDAMMDKILASGMKVNQVAGDGILKFNFAKGNKAFKSVCFTLYSIERVKPDVGRTQLRTSD